MLLPEVEMGYVQENDNKMNSHNVAMYHKWEIFGANLFHGPVQQRK